MELEVSNPALIDLITKAIGNTLLHSLWQGVLLWVFGGFVIVFGKKMRSSLRYNLLVGSFLLFTISVGVTFLWHLQDGGNSGGGTLQNIKAVMLPEVIAKTVEYNQLASYTIGFFTMLFYYLSNYYNIIVLTWFLVICMKSVQMIAGVHGIYYLKQTRVSAADEHWQQKVNKLCQQLHIKQAVYLLESGIAKVPMVIGHLKPIILIPIGLVNALSPREVEAILVHELAHISRKDFMVNLLQSLMEVVFFFNPAVLWMSLIIKAERENCCDDIAIEQTSSKVNYIRALVACQEYHNTAPTYSIALKSNKGQLLARVKRLLESTESSLNLIQKAILTICLASVILITAAFSLVPLSRDANSTDERTAIAQSKDGIEEERIQIKEIIAELLEEKLIRNKNKFIIRITNDALYIDGEKQSKKLHQRIVQKYVSNPSKKLNYTYSNSVNSD